MKRGLPMLVAGVGVATLAVVGLGGSNETNSRPSTQYNNSPAETRTADSNFIIRPLETFAFDSRNEVYVKYRDTPVNIGDSSFEYLDTSKSSWVRGAWYDSDNKYMVINLNGTYYHYCLKGRLPWAQFKEADSFGSYYNSNIKGDYSCQYKSVPSY